MLLCPQMNGSTFAPIVLRFMASFAMIVLLPIPDSPCKTNSFVLGSKTVFVNSLHSVLRAEKRRISLQQTAKLPVSLFLATFGCFFCPNSFVSRDFKSLTIRLFKSSSPETQSFSLSQFAVYILALPFVSWSILFFNSSSFFLWLSDSAEKFALCSAAISAYGSGLRK